MKKTILLSFLSLIHLVSAQAMGATPKPISVANPSKKIPSIDLGPELDSQEYLNASSIVGPSVDNFKKLFELSNVRTMMNLDNVDKCFSDDKSHDTLSDQISYYTELMIKDTPAMVGAIGSYYGTSENDNDYFPTSLIRHKLCPVTKNTLAVTLKNVPSQVTIDKLNRYSAKVNSLREQVIKGDMKAKSDLLHIWSRFFSCLGYTESLSSADSATSYKVAQKYAPLGYRKPAAVEFYEDPSQSAESKLNIGLFQFTPTSTGNIQPCIRAWNSIHKDKASSCQINQKGSQAEMIKALGSSYQSFNAFCGVHKLIQTFAVQVNTKNTSASHPSNVVNGKILSEENRCVSPHFLAGRAYNHFGPTQNSTGSNMDQLFSCIERSEN